MIFIFGKTIYGGTQSFPDHRQWQLDFYFLILILLSQKFYFDRNCEQWLLLLTEKLKYFSLISFNIIKYKLKNAK